MQHIVGKLSTSSFQRYKVCANRSSDEGVMAPGSRGVGAVFVHFSDEDSGQTGDAIGEPRVPRRSRSRYLSNAPGLADQLVASRKDSAREGGSCAAYFLQGSGFAEIRAWTCEIWPREQRPPEVFLVRLRAVFRSGIPARPRKTLRASVATSVGKFRNFQQNLISSACFHARGRRSSRCRISTILVSSESLCYLLFQRYRPCTEASLGSQDMILRTGGRRNVPYAKGFDHNSLVSRPFSTRKVRNRSSHDVLQNGQGGGQFDSAFGLVNGPVKPWSNLVNLGQTWSNLVKALQTLGNVSRTTFRGFLGTVGPSRVGNGSVKPRSTLVELGQTLVKLGSGRLGSGCPVLRADTRENPVVLPGSKWAFQGLEKIGRDAKRRFVARNGETEQFWELARDHHARRVTVPREMSDRGSGSGGHRRSDRLAKGKAVVYAPESSPDTDDERSSMPRLLVLLLVRPGLLLEPGVVIGRSARPSGTTRPSPQPGATTGHSDTPSDAPCRPHTRSTGIPPSRLKRQRAEGIPDSAGTIPEDYVAPGFRYPPQGGIRPRYPVAVEISDTPLLTNLLTHPSSLVRRCQEPLESVGRGGWSEFSRLLAVSRPEYREFLTELGFGPFLGIPYVSVYHPSVGCFVERFFHHTGTFHLSTCEMAVLPVDWSAILGIRFGGRAPPSEPVDGFEAREILGLDDRDAIEGSRRPSHISSSAAFFGNDKSTVPTPIVGMFRDIDALREYDWGALTYGFYIWGLRRYSRRESISFLGFWQFTIFWAFEHFPTFAPSRLPLASDPDFPLARRWDSSRIRRMTTRTLLELRMTMDCIRDADIVFQPYFAALTQRPEVFRAVELSHLRMWIRTPRSWELLLAPSDPYVAGVSAYPSLVREDVPYQEWFEQVSLGSLMSLHEVEGGRVMGGMAMDSHHIRSSGQIERLESEILRLQLELSVSVDRHMADMDRVQGEMASMQTEATQREGEMVQMRRDLDSRDAEVARLAAAVRRLEEQLQGMGINPVTGAGPSGFGQTSSPPPTDPVSRDWFFDDPPST
uniref:Aminotransferase-like plant mobile domain-containing protein n=1 Tax=Fagus sylvatica TaxID=28930 RepID=A0A2N9E3X7_FAGSY